MFFRSVVRSFALTLACAGALAHCASSNGREVAPQNDGGPVVIGDTIDEIQTCEAAAAAASYVGCDYWATVTANPEIDPTFDFAIVVAGVGAGETTVTITGPNGFTFDGSVSGGELKPFYLPWVNTLKGTSGQEATAPSVRAKGSYHVVTSQPAVVYQFNAIEYAPKGGPAGKNWSSCTPPEGSAPGTPCFSYSNDASLLIPSPAWGATYRVTSYSVRTQGQTLPGFISITGSAAGTDVTVTLPPGASTRTSNDGSIKAGNSSAPITFTLGAGEVVQLLGQAGDLTGALVSASQPVQVFGGHSCANVPGDFVACDHVEEMTLPAEALGQRYAVFPPSGPSKVASVGHVVRFVGNVDGTVLTYEPLRPQGCPTKLDAGQVVECNVGKTTSIAGVTKKLDGVVTEPFVVTGDHEFTVSTFLTGAMLTYFDECKSLPLNEIMPCFDKDKDGDYRIGDPSQTVVVPIEQFRSTYMFLAPTDYLENYVDVTMESGTTLELDGKAVSASYTEIAGGLGFAHVRLAAGKNGAHTLTASKPVGIQVLGYGSYTSYAYPGGGNFKKIAPTPIR